MSPGAADEGSSATPGDVRPRRATARPLIATAIPEDWDGWPLTAAVSTAAELDRAAADELIDRGGAWLDRRRCREAATRLREGQALIIHFPPPDEPRASVTADDILYEDFALLVLNKQPGAYVNMTPWDVTNNLLSATRQFLAARGDAPDSLHLAHQLDRDTSGVLLFTLDPRANAPIQDAFVRRTIHKRYLALVGGIPDWRDLEMHTGHGRGPHGLFQIYPLDQVGTHPEGRRHVVKEMHTRFALVEQFADTALIEAEPLTGRTHQIRLHLHHTGYPVAGDARYGGPLQVAGVDLSHHLLHATSMELLHPLHRRPLRLDAPLPPVFAATLQRLRQPER